MTLNSDSEPFERMQTAMGQGRTLISPYHLALIGCAIANDGKLMRPYVVNRIENHKGKTV